MAQLILMPGKERSAFKQHHPWLFAGSVGRLEGRARPGDTVEVLADNLRPLGKAAYSPKSQIRARFWTFDPEESVDDAFFKRRIATAVARRQALPELRGQQGLRLIHAESDGLPGVIADQYADTIVVQLTSAGADKWRNAIVAGLVKATGCARIYERSDSDVRGLEGLEPTTGWIYGEAPGDAAERSRKTVSSWRSTSSAATKPVSTSTSATTAPCLANWRPARMSSTASATPADFRCRRWPAGRRACCRSIPPVRRWRRRRPIWRSIRNCRLSAPNGGKPMSFRRCAISARKAGLFDLIVLDPPKFAPSAAHAERAARAYKDINVLGCRLLKPGGLLMTYSCSGGIGLELFQKIVAGAAVDAGREARIVRRLAGSADHPVALNFPEGEYLKGLLVQVD
jgi:23S rRNA (cytosine1962-C5)-methyltransferase